MDHLQVLPDLLTSSLHLESTACLRGTPFASETAAISISVSSEIADAASRLTSDAEAILSIYFSNKSSSSGRCPSMLVIGTEVMSFG